MTLSAPTKIVCVGRNYAKHAAELGNDVPAEPLIFLKPPSAIVREGEPIVIPSGVGRVDFEGEIGLVIGSRARKVPAASAWDHVSAIVPINDVTARDLQVSDGQWTRSKGFDTFCPVGVPVPLAEVDLERLGVTTRVNGEVRQNAPSSDMVFDMARLIQHISGIMTLEVGDLIVTGTPEGIGPLQVGDEVSIEVIGVGTLTNPVAAGA